MPLFGPRHLTLLDAMISPTVLRSTPGLGLAINELIWWRFRYSHEGAHLGNLPLQLCDASLWATVLGCTTLFPPFVEFTYFAGIAGAGMALLTPDLVSPWPSYTAGDASLLDALGPWPVYLAAGAAVGLALFWLLWLLVRPRRLTLRRPGIAA